MRSNLHYWQLVLCNCTHKRMSHNISHKHDFTNRSHKDVTQASQTCMISQTYHTRMSHKHHFTNRSHKDVTQASQTCMISQTYHTRMSHKHLRQAVTRASQTCTMRSKLLLCSWFYAR